MELVVSVSPEGEVRSAHNDRFSLGFLGRQRIERASDIRWDEDSQTWGIWWYHNTDDFAGFVTPAEPYSYFKTYEDAREFEVEMLNCSLRTGFHPCSNELLQEAVFMRDRA